MPTPPVLWPAFPLCPVPTCPSAPGSSCRHLHALLHTVLQMPCSTLSFKSEQIFVSPHLISCTVWDGTLLKNLQWFPVVQKRKQTSTPGQFPRPCHLPHQPFQSHLASPFTPKPEVFVYSHGASAQANLPRPLPTSSHSGS